MKKDLGIVIVNWNTCDHLRRCLETVFASAGDLTYDVVIVDNASSDGSAEMVRAEFPQAHVIASAINGGYPYGNNVGLRYLGFNDGQPLPRQELTVTGPEPPAQKPRYVLLLNPDTLVPPDAFAEMVAYMDARPQVGIAGPKVVLMDGSLDLACRRGFPTPEVSLWHFSRLSKLFPKSKRFGRYNMTYLDEDAEAEVDSVVGAFMMLRAAVIDAVGLLDERFFMYGEDLDWAFRAKAAGWKVMYAPHVHIQHVKRAASRKSARAQREFVRAMLLFYRKHYEKETPRWLHLLVLAGIGLKGGLPMIKEILRGGDERG